MMQSGTPAVVHSSAGEVESMSLVFLDPVPARPGLLDAFESSLGVQLPALVRELLTEVSNGGEVEPVGLKSAADVSVVAVLGVGRSDHLDLEARLSRYEDSRLPDGLVPIADAEGGNLVCVSVRADDVGTVWFWDHERELPEESVVQVAPDFDAFVADLAPSVVEELPSMVEAWIDPLLLAELDGKGGEV